MHKVLYSKFSKDREKKYQIATLILEQNGEKRILKKPVHEEGKVHLEKMQESYSVLSELYKDARVKICPCQATADGVFFPFVEGESLENRIRFHGETGQYEELKKDFRFLADVIFSVKNMRTFQTSPEFEEIFGTPEFAKPQHSGESSNIDMIPANLLMGDGCTVVDYEWVFPFEIPLEFIYARSLFLQETVAGLDKELQRELYAMGNVNLEEIPVYYAMEVKFQEYVAGKGEKYALSHLYEKMHCEVHPVRNVDYSQFTHELKVEGFRKGNWEEIDFIIFDQTEIHKTLSLDTQNTYDRIRILPEKDKCILKIYEVSGRKEKEKTAISFSDNSELLIIDDYYFSEPPVLEFENPGFDCLEIHYLIYRKNDGAIDQLIHFIKREKELMDKNQILTDQVFHMEQRIRRIESLQAYKMYKKMRNIVKRGN
ncbi:MAG: hypothetical protein ACI4EO_06950 [Blautia sp.]